MALTRTESSDETLTVFTDADSVYTAALSAFSSVGTVETRDASFRRLVGRIRSGAANMNSATVTLSVEIVREDECRLRLGATAQEGLIKQHTAPKAISRFLEALSTHDLPTTAPTTPTEPTAQSSTGASPTELLAELAELRDQGVVTAEEFEIKKADLLRRI